MDQGFAGRYSRIMGVYSRLGSRMARRAKAILRSFVDLFEMAVGGGGPAGRWMTASCWEISSSIVPGSRWKK